MNLTEFMARRNQPTLIAIGLGLLAMVIVIQKASPPAFETRVFYLVPVSFFAWFIGRHIGLIVSFFSAAAALAIQRLSVPHIRVDIAYWNALAWFAVYVFFVQIISEIRGLYTRERTWSHTDPLTGIPNRRSFFERLEIEKSRERRYGRPLTLAYIDVDRFKQVNDTYGHSTGDQLLKIVGRIMLNEVRQSDIVARIGGDEFAVLFPETSAAAATTVLEELRSTLTAAMQQYHWPVSFSFGAVTFQPPPESVHDMISAADNAMYTAKKSGSGRFVHRSAA